MSILVLNKNTFTQSQYDNVTSIAFADNTYTITYGATTKTLSASSYKIVILW